MNNFHDIDLNLLKAFLRIYEAQSVTQAARDAHLTQSALSHALSKLRQMFDDPLFVREGGRLVPTPKAVQLYQPVIEAFSLVGAVVAAEAPFSPTACERTFFLALADYVELLHLPVLGRCFADVAPAASLQTMAVGDNGLVDQLRHADLAIARIDNLPPNFHRQVLWRETFVTVCSAKHPRIKGDSISLTQFLDEQHVMVATDKVGRGIVDEALLKLGLSRKVALKAGFFYSPSRIAATSELLATVPRSLAERLAPELRLKLLEPPLELDGFDVSMVWSPVRHHDAAHIWFRRWLRSVICSD